MLRATIICGDGDAFSIAVQNIIKVFDVRDGNGRLKNMLGTTKPMPPRILFNVVVHASGCQPAVAEVQVYLSSIKAQADMGHVYYEITRASSLKELITEKKGAVKHAKGSSDDVPVPTHTPTATAEERTDVVHLSDELPVAKSEQTLPTRPVATLAADSNPNPTDQVQTVDEAEQLILDEIGA